MSTVAPHSPLNISEAVRDLRSLVIKEWPIRNGQRGIEWLRDQWRHMTLNGQVVAPIPDV